MPKVKLEGEFRPKAFMVLLRDIGIPVPEVEYRFAPPRRWRFDYAWPELMLALEVEGGVWTKGRHTRGSGFVKDMEKYNEATARGWRLLRVTPDELCTAETLELIRRALNKEAA